MSNEMSKMNRRDFLRTAGIASTATVAACTYDYKVPQEYVLPYVKQGENVLPGTPSYISTMCVECPSACGMVARSKDGRVVHVEGNPDHPNGPGLCTRGHYGLVATYGPDRLAGPVQGNKALTWDDALKSVTDAMSAARAAGKSVAWLGQYRTGSAERMLDELASGVGLRRVHWEALGVETLLAATRAVFGQSVLPSFDLSEARTIVSFGMDFLSTAFGSMGMIKGWSKAKDPAHGNFVTRLVCVEPRVGASSSQADLWLAPNPGTETQVALAVARLVAEAKNYNGPAAGLLKSVDVAGAVKASGISEARLKEVAGWMAGGTSVALPGGHANASTDGTALAVATLLINEAAGSVGKTVVFGRELRAGQVNSYADVKALLDDARAGKVGVLFLDGVNPVYNLTGDDKVAEALGAVGLVVQLSNEKNDSTSDKTLLLPPGTNLETWGDAEAEAGVHTLQQPAMTALKDVRAVGDVLLAIGKALAPAAATPAATPAEQGAEAAAPAPVSKNRGFNYANYHEYIKARWQSEVFPLSGVGSFDDFWVTARQTGGLFKRAAASGATVVLSQLPQAGAGPAGSEPMALVVFPSPNLGDGRFANVPWAQELADPISTTDWTTWAEINPKTVERLGLGEKDTLKISNAKGSLTVGYFASPGVREDTVAIVLGNGHTSMGRYGTGRGQNPMALLSSQVDAASGALAFYTSKVQIARGGGESDFHALCGNIDQDGRPLANVVNAKDAVEHQKGEAGSIVPIHHIPVDDRLLEQKLTDMFPEPQHPTYRFAMAIDTNVCNGCMSCVIACALENNTPFIGPDQVRRGRTMAWIRMNRFWEGEGEHPDVRHMPSLCQQCSHAPCEGVCPVLATYHNLDGLNAMIYNRCVGTRYCANNCPYTARRFNYHTWTWPDSFHLMLNPDVSVREMGVMEKCTFCVQRLRSAKDSWRDIGEEVPDSALRKITACASACPSEAITFGNAKDPKGEVSEKWELPRTYSMLGELNTKPGIRYLARIRHDAPESGGHGGGHGGGTDHGGASEKHGAAPEKKPEHGQAAPKGADDHGKQH